MASHGAIITGAASGVGLELTKHTLSKGWKVVMMDINQDGAVVAMELGRDILFVQADVADWNSHRSAYQKAFKWCPEITFLAANAGVTTNMMAPYSIMSVELEDDLQRPLLSPLDVNLTGTIHSIKLFVHHTELLNLASPVDGIPKARIVITGSEGGLYALGPDPVYAASKHGLVGLTRSLGSAYLHTFGITVNSINLGYMRTPPVAPLIPVTPNKYETTMITIMRAFDELLSSNESDQVVEA